MNGGRLVRDNVFAGNHLCCPECGQSFDSRWSEHFPWCAAALNTVDAHAAAVDGPSTNRASREASDSK